jgi:DNA-binding HxlR family transcriptional regulator
VAAREIDYEWQYATLQFFTHRGTLELLGALEQRSWRYCELINAVREYVPHANTASVTLRRLVEKGVVSHDGVWYTLTPRGRAVLPAIKECVDRLGGIYAQTTSKTSTNLQKRRTA